MTATGPITGAAPVTTAPSTPPTTRAQCLRYAGAVLADYPELASKVDKNVAAAAVEEALRDGKFTRDEFNDIFGTSFTEEAWSAYVGHNRLDPETGEYYIATPEEAIFYQEEFHQFSEATGVKFEYFTRCSRVTIIDREEMLAFIGQIFDPNNGELLDALIANNYDAVKQFLEYNTQQNFDAIPDEAARRAAMRAAFLGLWQDPSPNGGRDKVEMFFYGQLNNLNTYARDNGFRLDDLGLQDPLVAQQFLDTVFTPYLCGSGDDLARGQAALNDGTYDTIATFAENVADLRELLRDTDALPYVVKTEGGRDIHLSDLEPGDAHFTKALELLAQGADRAAIEAELDQCAVIARPSAPPPALAGAAPNGGPASAADVPHVDPDSLAETEPEMAAAGVAPTGSQVDVQVQ